MPNYQQDKLTGMTWLTPDWAAPAQVRALCTTRLGGLSQGPYASLNLGDHVGDVPDRVQANRERLVQVLDLPQLPRWLQQVHGCEVATPGCAQATYDAAWTDRVDEVLVIMTADCLPVLLTDRHGRQIAAVHAGWRGLCDGVIEAALARFSTPGSEIVAWLGPAIGPNTFEVGPEVRSAFMAMDAMAEVAFRPGAGDRWMANIFELARQRLQAAGVSGIYGGDVCTFSDPDYFFSYRREGVTGRMASLIWRTA